MKESEFTEIISKLVVNLEKAGVYNDTLKESIDQLFILKDVIYLREGLKGERYCRLCKHFDDNYCNNISGEQITDSEIEIVGQSPVNGRIKFKVNPFWSCSHFKQL